MKNQLYFLKIKLVDIKPEIWRRFMIPANISLHRLHEVIQIVMGWGNCHLYEFIIDHEQYTSDPEDLEDGLDSRSYRLGSLLKRNRQSFEYVYDFGDCWRHKLTLEGTQYFDPGTTYKFDCLYGERACPPDDVGGVPGYYDFCEAMKDPRHEDHQRLKAWYGDDFDSEKFDMGAVCSLMERFNRKSRK